MARQVSAGPRRVWQSWQPRVLSPSFLLSLPYFLSCKAQPAPRGTGLSPFDIILVVTLCFVRWDRSVQQWCWVAPTPLYQGHAGWESRVNAEVGKVCPFSLVACPSVFSLSVIQKEEIGSVLKSGHVLKALDRQATSLGSGAGTVVLEPGTVHTG